VGHDDRSPGPELDRQHDADDVDEHLLRREIVEHDAGEHERGRCRDGLGRHALAADLTEGARRLAGVARVWSIRPVLKMPLLQADAAAVMTTRLTTAAADGMPKWSNTSTNGLALTDN
jgi:hypothetical protein